MAETRPMTMGHPQPRARDLFKADHPREIDRHIAFFGVDDATSRDMCGETLLVALTRGSSDTDEGSCPRLAEVVGGNVILAAGQRDQAIGPHGHDAILDL